MGMLESSGSLLKESVRKGREDGDSSPVWWVTPLKLGDGMK